MNLILLVKPAGQDIGVEQRIYLNTAFVMSISKSGVETVIETSTKNYFVSESLDDVRQAISGVFVQDLTLTVAPQPNPY